MKLSLRAFDGPLTGELARHAGGFGLGQVPQRSLPEALVTSVCGFCSTGCALDLHLQGGEAVNVTPAVGYPVNRGMACPKGWEALAPLSAPDRARYPLYREDRSGPWRRVTWDQAAAIFCRRMKETMELHGQESAAFLSTGQMVTEEMALLGALAKFGMGMRHGDGNTRQCMATSVAAYKESFGFDAPPYTYADFEESDVIVLIGSNLCITHPILWDRILANRRSPKIVVIDPRVTETAMAATCHLPVRPRSDLALFYGLTHLIIARGWVDHAYVEAHTQGFARLADHVKAFTPERVRVMTGVGEEALERLAESIGCGGRVSLWWTMGINQGHEATRTAQAIINLALITGNMGRPGTGANSITGQCNAMGSRLFSNTSNLLGGHDFTNSDHRRKVSSLLGLAEEAVPVSAGKAYDQILDGIDTGETRALWVVATNGAHSWGHSENFRRRASSLDFLVVQDMYASTETAQLADLILPAAGWGEKEGTFINSERRLGMIRKVRRAPGEALADFQIFRLLGRTWGGLDWIERWSSPEKAFDLLKGLSRGQPCDFTGVEGYADLEAAGGRQWPYPVELVGALEGVAGERRLFSDGKYFTEDGRARLVVDEMTPSPEAPDDEFPLTLITGRGSSAQWHTQTRTGKSAILRKLYPAEAYVEVHPDDAVGAGCGAGERVEVVSRHGNVRVIAVITPTVGRGQLFMPMHYSETNALTCPVVDPHSRQPSYKATAVHLRSGTRRAEVRERVDREDRPGPRVQ